MAGVLMLPLLFLAGAVSLAVLPLAVLANKARERRLVRRMMRQDRYLTWADVSERLGSGEGSLILDQVNKRASRVWWTADDIERVAPCAPASDEELDYVNPVPPHPFSAWCTERYLDTEAGTAYLTSGDDLPREPLVTPQRVRERFPRARAYAIARVA